MLWILALGAGNARSQVQMLTFDEQFRSTNVSMHFYFWFWDVACIFGLDFECIYIFFLHIESKKKTASMNQSARGETSSSNQTQKDDEVWKNTENIDLSFLEKDKITIWKPEQEKGKHKLCRLNRGFEAKSACCRMSSWYGMWVLIFASSPELIA